MILAVGSRSSWGLKTVGAELAYTVTRRNSFRRNPSLRSGGKNQLEAGGSKEIRTPGAFRGPVGLTEVCVEAALKARRTC
jgi:hypothetical protein